MVKHGGGQGGYGSWMMRFPELHLSVVVLFNHFPWDMQDYAIKVADLFLEDRVTPETQEGPATPREAAIPVELSAERLQDKAGIYYDARMFKQFAILPCLS